MSERDGAVRRLAEEVRQVVEQDWTGHNEHDARLIADRLLAFLTKREAQLSEEIVRDYEDLKTAESALRHHGYRKSCDIPACNCGDQWMHGGHADSRLREIREELGEHVDGQTLISAVRLLVAEAEGAERLAITNERQAHENADLQAQLHRALGELAGLREALEETAAELVKRADLYGKGEPGDDDWRKARNSGLAAGSHDAATLIRIALARTSSPLSERAGDLFETVDALSAIRYKDIDTPEVQHGLQDLVRIWDALRAELAKGGKGGL